MTATPAAALFIPPLDPQTGITPDAPSTPLTLPTDSQFAWRMKHLGGLPEATYYHPDAVLHVHGNGIAQRLPLNPVAWTLASAWHGAQLPYLLVGPAVITGTEDHDGNFTPLSAPLADQTHNAIAAATAWWRDNHLHLPLWPFSLDSPAFAPAITATRNAL
ncbi:DUF3846 domain-containing protein [Streptomyces sp. NPDC058525]|uniref:DUF3846 domain-containing protein n=1 Tax=Streptomyces sp. NPDC058525 TaxID=3346538 RepID=UPI00364D5C55